MPSRSSIAVICGPPPCTTTGLIPAYRRYTMSSANARCRSALTIALPPNFTTIVSPENRFNHGRESISTCALAAADSEWWVSVMVVWAFRVGGGSGLGWRVGVNAGGGEDISWVWCAGNPAVYQLA